jgi:hypothetical protein
VRRYGLACSGNAGHTNDAQRSIPLERLAPVLRSLAAAPCGSAGDIAIEWHLLQREVRPDDEPWLKVLEINDHREHLVDFAETAALAACMDAVVSVDTSVAHLAGALGIPLHVLLAYDPDWRWLLGRDDTPWYPTARLYRQGRPGDWEEPLRQLGRALT